MSGLDVFLFGISVFSSFNKKVIENRYITQMQRVCHITDIVKKNNIQVCYVNNKRIILPLMDTNDIYALDSIIYEQGNSPIEIRTLFQTIKFVIIEPRIYRQRKFETQKEMCDAIFEMFIKTRSLIQDIDILIDGKMYPREKYDLLNQSAFLTCIYNATVVITRARHNIETEYCFDMPEPK
jgi:hypothetical protein